MASIEKRLSKDNKISYRVKVRLKGFPTQHATFERLTDARNWVQQTEADIKAGRYFQHNEAKKHTLREAIERYIEVVVNPKKEKKPRAYKDQLTQLSWWNETIGCYVLSDVTPPLIVQCREQLCAEITSRKKQRSSATVNRYLAVLSHLFTIAVKEWYWLNDNPMRKVSKMGEPSGRVRFLSDDERGRLINAAKDSKNHSLYLIIVLCLSTGARKMEIIGLKWSDIDLERGAIILQKTKNKERRFLPVTGLALDLLNEHRKIRSIASQLVFPGDDPKKPIDIRSAWERALKQAQIEDFRFHDLRHSAASYLVMNGSSLTEVAKILGHKTIQMVSRYAHLSDEHIATKVEQMNKKIFG